MYNYIMEIITRELDQDYYEYLLNIHEKNKIRVEGTTQKYIIDKSFFLSVR